VQCFQRGRGNFADPRAAPMTIMPKPRGSAEIVPYRGLSGAVTAGGFFSVSDRAPITNARRDDKKCGGHGTAGKPVFFILVPFD